MLRAMREGSQKHPWILWLILITITVTFVIVGAWDYQGSQANVVAEVGPYKVSLDEYRRTKQNYSRFYREQLKQEDVKEETIQQLAITSLVEAKTWNIMADQLGLSIAPEELTEAIVAQKEFHRDGKFDPQFYERLLQANRMTPHEFEEQRTVELIRDKARLLVMESTTLTPAELKEVNELASRQASEGSDEPDAATLERIKLQFLFQKKQRSVQAFQAAMRANAEVQVHEELL